MPKLTKRLQAQIERGIAVLREGGTVAFPTDTVYGLGARADNQWAVAKVYQIKQRRSDVAVPLLLARPEQLNEVAESVPPIAKLLAEKFWPGALTIVVIKSSAVPDIVTAGGPTVAVRVPDHPVPIALIEGVGVPIIGTSANLSGQPSPLTAAEVRAQLDEKADLIIDGGRCKGGVESTVIDVTGKKPVILREGAISRERLREVIPGL